MENECSVVKRILAIAFSIFMAVGFVKSGSYKVIGTLFEYLKQEDYEAEDAVKISTIEVDFNAGLWKHNNWISLNGYMAKQIKMQGYYSNIGLYITDNGYIVSCGTKTSTDYEVEQTVAFRDFLMENGVNLLYVNEPTKYIDDSLFRKSFGVETFSNRNADLFLSRIRDAGINTIDLRDNIRQEGIAISDLFYRTDHHWTTPAGLWATRIMAEGLNNYCDYDIDLSIYNEENYDVQKWTSCWLGEQGKKVAVTYVGLDDYTEIKPKFMG